MYLYENKENKINHLDYMLKRNTKTIAFTTISKQSCSTYCSLPLSKVLELKKGDQLYVSSYGIDIKFFMSCNNASFGMYMLKQDYNQTYEAN